MAGGPVALLIRRPKIKPEVLQTLPADVMASIEKMLCETFQLNQNTFKGMNFCIHVLAPHSARLRQKIQRIMKLTALLMIIGTLHVCAGASAQKITLHEKNVSLTKVFRDIRKQTGLDFFYDAALINQAGAVSIDVKDASLQEALDDCFRNTALTFSIRNGAVIINERPPVAAPIYLGNMPEPIDTPRLMPGKVTDAKGNPLAGVSVMVKGLGRGTVTNGDGVYLIGVDRRSLLVFSYVGYETQEVPAGTKHSISIVMQLDIAELDQTQVIAYGTTTKRYNTGEQTTVSSREIERYPVSNVLTALQAKVPGLIVSQTSGVPGSSVKVNIRGQNGLTTGTAPLYIVDGIPLQGGSYVMQNTGLGNGFQGQDALNFINPLDIESVDVLKDADATAIYGSRGANGVILITTKKGKAGATRVVLNAYTGISNVPYRPKVLNLQQYLEMRHEAKRNDGTTITAADYDINGTWDSTHYTNWGKKLLGNGQTSNAQISVSGGSGGTQFLISGNYRRQNNIEQLFGGKDQTGALHFNISNTSPDGRLSASLTGGYTYDVNTIPPGDEFSSIYTLAPDAPNLLNADGSLNFQNGSFPGNPLLASRYLNKTSSNNFMANATFSYRLLQGLELKAILGYNKQQINEFLGTPAAAYYPGYGITTGSANFTTDNNTYWSLEPQINYTRDIGKGHLTATIGYSLQKQTQEALPLQATGYTSDLLLSSPTAGTSLSALAGFGYSLSVYKFTGNFGRINYIWDNKYLLDLTGRYDGSTKFGPDHRFHLFSAVGAGWIFTEEKFFKGLRFLNFGKLRASYGVTGNDQIGNGLYVSSYYSTGYSYQGTPSVLPSNIANPDISWETTRKAELAMELHFFKSRIELTGNYFRNRTSDLLSSYQVPSTTGFLSVTRNEPGLVQNKGFDLTLTTNNIRSKNFSWSTTILFTKMRNQVLQYPPTTPAQQAATNLYVGWPPNVVRLYKFAGVNTQTGVYQYYNAKGVITSSNLALGVDNTVLLDPNPKYFGSVGNTFSYKGWSLDVLFRFIKQQGRSALSMATSFLPAGWSQFNVSTTALGRWQKQGDVASAMKYTASFLNYTSYSYLLYSTAGWSDASYVRLQNASLNYTFDNAWTKKMHMQHLRLYVLGENLLTITHYGGVDPETQTLNHLPLTRTITGGLQVNF